MPLGSFLSELVSHLDLQFSSKLELSASYWEGKIFQTVNLRAKLEWAGENCLKV